MGGVRRGRVGKVLSAAGHVFYILLVAMKPLFKNVSIMSDHNVP